MSSPVERDFATYPRGDRREEQLANFRIGMRALTNPSTGLPFTETEIATATGPGSRYYNEADAIDVVLTAEQSRALWLADQVRPDRAGTAFLQGYHSNLWQLPYLRGTGSSGPAAAKALPGTVFAGSTILGDPAALVCTDPAGLRYQVRTTVFTDGNGVATPSLVAVDAGTVTNIPSGTILTWVAPPLNAQPKATASDNFTGGTDDENDAEFVKRLLARIRHKQAAGNQSHMRSWARDASNAVEDACVYPHTYRAVQLGASVTMAATVNGVAAPFDVALGGRLFTIHFAEVPVWPAPAITSPAAQSSVASFTPTVLGHYLVVMRRQGGGGAVAIPFELEAG